MTESICQRDVLAARPQGRPKLSDLRLEKVELRAIQEGEIGRGGAPRWPQRQVEWRMLSVLSTPMRRLIG